MSVDQILPLPNFSECEKGVNAAEIQARARERVRAAQRAAQEAAQAAASEAQNTTEETAQKIEEEEEEEEEVGESSAAGARRRTRASTSNTPQTKARPRRRAARNDDDEYMKMDEGEDDEEEADTSITLQTSTSARKRKRATTTVQVNLSALGEDSDEDTPVRVRGRKLTKAQLKKQKEAEAKKHRRGLISNDSDSDFEMARVPVPGQIAFCAECNCRFTVTPYSKSSSDGDGLLCHACGKKNAPVEVAAKKKRQTTRTNKKSSARALLDGDRSGVKTLQEMCIALVAKHIDDVEALGDIGSHNMDKICQIISKNRSLNDHTMKLFLEPAEHVLRFYDCSKIQSDNLRQIGAFCPSLQRLHLKFCGRMNDDCLDYYGTQLKELKALDLFGAFNVTEECYVRFFENCGRKLKEFGVSDTSRFRVKAMEALVDNCPDLEVLRLKTLTNIDDECIRLLTGLPNLRILEISEPTMELTDGPIIDILNTCGSALRELNLNQCSQLTDLTIDAIHESCGQLEILELERVELLTSEGLTNLFTGWDINHGLTTLNLTRCIELDAAGFAKIIDHSGRTLERFNINSCKEVNQEAWDFLMEFTLPQLEEFDVSFIRSVNDAVLEGLMKVAPKMHTIKAWGCFKLTEAIPLREGLHLIGREADLLS
ncbi:hypothetical protein H072_2882 [Dactylellina haptotyla CBS 200.50]|uniref:DNA repair protein rhp7 treble clef domain-containing protein n=1 Tax=Dactylellina haptotyla (strain CBS 200.50) TaxID=1284197 RepID=S8AJL1_DACHA|nr:hypothetical protein H072_2882 [Dactylellina haptotyla CBS 200.50]